MKAVLVFSSLFVTLSFVPFALSRHFPYFPPVLDVEGKELKLGAAYYVVSKGVIYPEGLCLVDDVNNQSAACPHDVIQCSLFHESPHGLPVIFSPVDNATEDAVVRERTSYKIQFSVAGNCSSETVWTLVDTLSPFWKYVATDPDTPSVQFQLHKIGLGYEIDFCETIPIPRTSLCYGLGFIQAGFYYSRLGAGLGVNPVEFFFVRNATALQKPATATSFLA